MGLSAISRTAKRSLAPAAWFFLTLAGIAALTSLGPSEKSLGSNVRVVYLHGVWVWAALCAFIAAGLTGLLGLITRRLPLHHWSRALGRTGLLFWVTYLPISIWAMQTNWNGLFLAEPRFRVAVIFSVAGLLLQLGLTLLENPAWASAGNVCYILALVFILRTTENVMHPPSPILTSESLGIRIYFFALLALTLLAAWQAARWAYLADPPPSPAGRLHKRSHL